MKYVILIRHDNDSKSEHLRDRLFLVDLVEGQDAVQEKVAFYIYHWEGTSKKDNLNAPFHCPHAQCSIWYETLDYFNNQRI